MVSELTGMEVANASLLDEATAAAEAMTLLHRVSTKKTKRGSAVCFWSAMGVPADHRRASKRASEPLVSICTSGRSDQLPPMAGHTVHCCNTPTKAAAQDLSPFIKNAHENGVLVAVGAGPPGTGDRYGRLERLARTVVFGNSQRFGVPLGFGGPPRRVLCRASVLRTPDAWPHHRLSVDAHGKTAYRMALATREQHIRREKATSNICTAQALLANMAAMYGSITVLTDCGPSRRARSIWWRSCSKAD
jgi:glycine dehydrogenase